jgi:hypothetical protein
MKPLKGIIYNCRKATYLADKRMNGGISFKESIELRIHLIRCDVCRLYIQQSGKINQMIKDLLKTQPTENIQLDDDFKTELQMKIDTELNKN